VKLDIQMMRSDKLGYNAPIDVLKPESYREFIMSELKNASSNYKLD